MVDGGLIEIFNFLAISSNLLSFLDQSPVNHILVHGGLIPRSPGGLIPRSPGYGIDGGLIEIFNFLAISSNLLSFLDQSPVNQILVHGGLIPRSPGYGRRGID